MQEVTPGQVGLTVGLAMISAIGFLLLRCQGTGRPFGPAGRWLAVAIVMLTGLVSASVALVGGIVLDQYLSTLLGAVAPSGLWFSQVRAGEPERRTVGKEMATFWLVSLLGRLEAIERRLDVAALIEDGASRSKVVTALGGSRHTKLARYERYLHDLTRLHGILRHDAENDLLRLLASAYRAGHRSLPRYVPPSRSRTVTEPVSPHP
ncbi:hypothetical protein [Nonomuraea cavernae]|uniref:hypothetical protein n=1 Tax=Nonomuraea cavernae TaxID=2045107 RepID=UPI0033D66477